MGGLLGRAFDPRSLCDVAAPAIDETQGESAPAHLVGVLLLQISFLFSRLFSTRSSLPYSAMQRLPSVSVQLIMQFLPVQEILALARCSKFTLHCAASDFAFRHSALTVQWRPKLSDHITGRLAPFIPIALYWNHSLDLAAALPGPAVQLRELHAPQAFGIEDQTWAKMLSHPCVQTLQILSMRRIRCTEQSMDDQILRTLIALPQLRALTFSAEEFKLSGDDSGKAARRGQLARPVEREGSLLELSLLRPAFGRMRSAQLFASPLLARLRVLRLTMFFVEEHELSDLPPINDAELKGMFASLSALEELHLARVQGVARLLSRAAESASLRRICYTPCSHGDRFTAPPAAFLFEVLRKAPLLQCEINFRARPGYAWSKKEEVAFKEWMEALAACNEAQSVTSRLIIESNLSGIYTRLE